MKKSTLILGAAIVALSFTSCKKEYTCECTVNGTVFGSTTITETKSNAETACNAGDSEIMGIVTDCEIK